MSVDPSLDYMHANELQHLRSLLTSVRDRTAYDDADAMAAILAATADVEARIQVMVDQAAALENAREAAREAVVNKADMTPTPSA